MEWLAGLQIGQVTLSTIGGVSILMLLLGRLITLREHLETRADRDAWRQEAQEKDELLREALAQNTLLLSGPAKLGAEVMKSVDQNVKAQREQE